MSWNWSHLSGEHDFLAEFGSRAKIDRGAPGAPPHTWRAHSDVTLARVNKRGGWKNHWHQIDGVRLNFSDKRGGWEFPYNLINKEGWDDSKSKLREHIQWFLCDLNLLNYHQPMKSLALQNMIAHMYLFIDITRFFSRLAKRLRGLMDKSVDSNTKGQEYESNQNWKLGNFWELK